MSLLSRNLIVACNLACVCLLSATPVRGQSTVYQSSQIIDHSSMSPDSWSAPQVTNASPHSAPGTPLPYSAPANVPQNALQQPSTTTLARASATPEQAKPLANNSGPTKLGSPSIPDLGSATSEQTPRVASLIQQPATAGRHPIATAQLPFRSAKYSKGSQTGSGVIPFQASGSLPNSLQATGSATRAFDLGTTVAPSPTSPTLVPTTESPVFGGAVSPTPSGRYPLGINSQLPDTPQLNELATGPSVQTYDSLVNSPLTTQPRGLDFNLSEQLGPVVTQPTPVIPQPALSSQTLGSSSTFRPDLGHRSPNPTFRGRDHDSGLKLDFEDKKKQYPGLGEILATGRYFGSFSTLFLQPSFQQNSVITQFNSSLGAATFASSESFDFDYETAPRFRVGFESEFGPGVELDYWQFDQGSNVSAFTSNGLNSGELSSGLFGPSSLTTLTAANAGETLSAIHSIDIETFSVTFFKEIKFPISRLNGIFGFQYASVFQSLDAELTDAGGNVIGAIQSTSDLRAYGPKLKFEYYRPVGHTKLEFISAFGGSVLFGERDQIVTNTGAPAVNRFGADEYVLTSDFYGGVQWKKLTAEKRGYFVRVGVTHQSWVGGGSAVSSESNFGLRGFAFEVGLNR